jgi:hypothetical protein
MSSSLNHFVGPRWKDDDEDTYDLDDDYRYNDRRGRGSNSNNHDQYSFENIETLISQIFGSCSSNIQSFFGGMNNSPRSSYYHPGSNRTNRTTGASTMSESTETTAESSTQSKSRAKAKAKARTNHNVRRSRSMDCRRTKKSCDPVIRRHRSMSKSYVDRTSILPRPIENTEIIAVENLNDDVSAISAQTLNEMYADELRLKAITKVHQKKYPSMHTGMGKENIPEEDSLLSSDSTDFESIWRSKSNGSISYGKADNRRANTKKGLQNASICRDSRYTKQRELKKNPFATIDENDSLYVDEQEI